jgi:predicted HTH transcriptional regulator
VFDDGTVESNEPTEKLQVKISQEIGEIYPPILPQILTREIDGKKFIIVVVQGSIERPHFAGPSYVRKDSQSVKASEPQFNALIASRNSKTSEILKWKDRVVTLDMIQVEDLRRFSRVHNSYARTVRDCNQFFVTLEQSQGEPRFSSFALRQVEIVYDHIGNRLKLEVYPY